MFNKARYDAEVWLYRANGAVDLIADREFDASKEQDRDVILYGNATINSSWNSLLDKSPIQLRNGEAAAAGHAEKGGDIGCIFLQPRTGSATALVGVVGGTGLEGMRATDRLPYFTSGVGYPDFTLFRANFWDKGISGVIGAGFFGNNWRLSEQNMVWRSSLR